MWISGDNTINCVLKKLELLQIPLCDLPEGVSKMMGDWFSQRPDEALSKFMLWLLKEVLEDSQSQQSGSHKGSKATPQPSGKTKVSSCSSPVNIFPLRSYYFLSDNFLFALDRLGK